MSGERRECTPSRQENTLAPVYCEQDRWKGGVGWGGGWVGEIGGRGIERREGAWGEMIGIEESNISPLFSVNILTIPIS